MNDTTDIAQLNEYRREWHDALRIILVGTLGAAVTALAAVGLLVMA